MVEMELAKNKEKDVTLVMKDGFFNPPSDEESDVVVSKEESIHTASRNKEKIKETKHENLRISTEINNAPTLGIVWSNNKYSLTPSDEKVMRLFQKREAFILHQEIRKR